MKQFLILFYGFVRVLMLLSTWCTYGTQYCRSIKIGDSDQQVVDGGGRHISFPSVRVVYTSALPMYKIGFHAFMGKANLFQIAKL
jgi:hypothetical protein